MATEEQIKAECRLYALEWATTKLWALVLKSQGAGVFELDLIRQQMSQGTQNHSFSNVGPAMSDLLSAEMEMAIDRILQMTRGMLHPNP